MQIKTTENFIQRKQTSCCVVMVCKIKCSHSSTADNSGLLGCDAVPLSNCFLTFWPAWHWILRHYNPSKCLKLLAQQHVTSQTTWILVVLLRVRVTYRYEVFMVLLSSGLKHHVHWKVNINILRENIAPIFRNPKTEKLYYSNGGMYLISMHGILMQKIRIWTKFYSLSEKSPGCNTQVK